MDFFTSLDYLRFWGRTWYAVFSHGVMVPLLCWRDILQCRTLNASLLFLDVLYLLRLRIMWSNRYEVPIRRHVVALIHLLLASSPVSLSLCYSLDACYWDVHSFCLIPQIQKKTTWHRQLLSCQTLIVKHVRHHSELSFRSDLARPPVDHRLGSRGRETAL